MTVWNPDDLPSWIDCSPELLEPLGMIEGVDADRWFSTAWDARPDCSRFSDSGLSWARESAKGIELKRHPEAALLGFPFASAIVDRWRCTTSRELTEGHYDRWSNYAIEAWVTMLGASRREESRRLKGAHSGES